MSIYVAIELTFGNFQFRLLFDAVSTHELSAIRMKSHPFLVMFENEYRRTSPKNCM